MSAPRVTRFDSYAIPSFISSSSFLCVLVVLSCLPTDSQGWEKREQEQRPLSQFPSSFLFLSSSLSLSTPIYPPDSFSSNFPSSTFFLLLFFSFLSAKRKTFG